MTVHRSNPKTCRLQWAFFSSVNKMWFLFSTFTLLVNFYNNFQFAVHTYLLSFWTFSVNSPPIISTDFPLFITITTYVFFCEKDKTNINIWNLNPFRSALLSYPYLCCADKWGTHHSVHWAAYLQRSAAVR